MYNIILGFNCVKKNSHLILFCLRFYFQKTLTSKGFNLKPNCKAFHGLNRFVRKGRERIRLETSYTAF
jgi:hypothetical protein